MGFWSLLSSAHVRIAKPTCFRLFVQLMRCARALARASAGNNMAARMAMIAITTNNSISVKALICFRRFFITFVGFYFIFLFTLLTFSKKSPSYQLIFMLFLVT